MDQEKGSPAAVQESPYHSTLIPGTSSGLRGSADTPLGSGQKHHTPIRGETATIERTGDFLASDGWKPERLNRIIRRVWLGVIG